MKINPARFFVGLIIAVAIAAALFRVVTGPDRAKDRRETARTVCIGSGGEWVKGDGGDVCVRETAQK